MAMMRTISAGMSRAAPTSGVLPHLGAVMSAAGVAISQATAMMIPTVYACVDRLASDIARCTPRLYTKNADGSKSYVTDHPVCNLLSRPNLQQSWFEFSHMLNVGLLLRGNGYAVKRYNARGQVIDLIPVSPDCVTVLEALDGQIWYQVSRQGLWQMAMLRDFDTAIVSDDVLHFRGLSFNGLVGVSTIGLAKDTLGLDMGQTQQAARWIGNGARPATWLKSSKPLSTEAAARLKRQFDALHAGVQNTGSTVVLEDGVEPVALQLTSTDLQFMDQRKFSVLDICRFFHVPPHKVGVTDAQTSGSNMAAQDQDYVNTAITPRLTLEEQRLQMAFGLAREGIFVELDTDDLTRADVMTRANVSRLNILSGKTTQNEERIRDGLAPLEGGDTLLVPSNMAGAGSDITGQAADGAGRPNAGTLSDAGAGTGEKS